MPSDRKFMSASVSGQRTASIGAMPITLSSRLDVMAVSIEIPRPLNAHECSLVPGLRAARAGVSESAIRAG